MFAFLRNSSGRFTRLQRRQRFLSGAAFEPGDALGIALVVTAIGLGIGAMVYTQRLGRA